MSIPAMAAPNGPGREHSRRDVRSAGVRRCVAPLLVAASVLSFAPAAAAWDPFWSEDAAVERGNERFLAQQPREAIEAYRSAPLSQRAEVQYDIGLAALTLAQSAGAAAQPTPTPTPTPATGADAGAAGDAGTPPAGPPPATPTDDLSSCLTGVRPACLRLAAASFARATDARGDSALRANAFHSLGDVYLLQADDLSPPAPPAVPPDLESKECKDVQAVLQAFEQPLAALTDAIAPLDKATEQFRSALLERPDDQDSAWNLGLTLRRKRDLEHRKGELLAQQDRLQQLAAAKCKDQNQQNQNQQQNQDQQQQNQDQQQQNQDQQQQNQDQQQNQQQQQDEQQRQQEQQQQQQRQQSGQQQDTQQQLQNLRDQEELFQQMRQRQDARDNQEQEQQLGVQPLGREEPEIDW